MKSCDDADGIFEAMKKSAKTLPFLAPLDAKEPWKALLVNMFM